ncbi:Zinc finger protein 836 [Anthophora plagiata]
MVLKDRTYILRRRFNKSKKIKQLVKEKNNLEALCKPLSVNIVKLSVSELHKLRKTSSQNAETKGASPRKTKPQKKEKQKKVKKKEPSNFINKYQCMPLSKKRYLNNESDKRNLLKSMKQPHIKLHRIDEVINKIAHSLVKAVSKKGCQTGVHTEDLEETETALDDCLQSQESVVSPPNSHANENEQPVTHMKNNRDESQVSPSNSYANENEQSVTHTKNNRDESSDTNECSQNFVNENCKRKDSVKYFSNNDSVNISNDSSDWNEMISNKRTLISDIEEITDACVPNNECNIIETKCINEDPILQIKSFQSLHTPCELFTTEENVPLKYEQGNVDETIQEGNATCVPSECNIEENSPLKVEDHITIIEETLLICEDTVEEQVEKAFISDEDLIQKYKLFKELRVFLIKLDFIKNCAIHKYSAAEIEQLTEVYVNSLIDSNCTNALQLSALLNRTKAQETMEEPVVEKLSSSIPSEDSVAKPEELNTLNEINTNAEYAPNSNISKNLDKDAPTVINKTQSIGDPLSNTLKRSSSSLNREKSSKIPKIRHNLTKYFEDNFKEIPEQNISVDRSKQDTMALSSTIESTVPSSIIESTVPSSTIESTAPSSTQKPIDKSSKIKSTNAKSSMREKISKNLSHTKSRKLVIDTRSQRKVVNTSRIVTSKSLLSNAKEYVSTPEKISVGRTCGKFVSMNSIQLNTKKNQTIHCPSIISPQKRNKPVTKKDKESTFYKCIICDHYYKNYSNLKLHLTIHTQNLNNTSTSSKSKDSTAPSGETEKVKSRFDGNEANKDIKSTNTVNKKRKQKKSKLVSVCDDSNKCSMCSRVFTSRSDLAAHIFLHTESELQKVYELKKQKMKMSREIEKAESKHMKATKTVKDGKNTVDKTPHVTKKRKSNETLVAQNSKIRATESTDSDKSHPKAAPLYLQTQMDTEKLNKETSGKKSFKICKCHNTPGTSENCLQIEIVLLCHTCRILFRTMNCFETHYRLPEYATCNHNRLISGRSPNLFCTTCGMIFSSVQDVRHHLELHARFKQNATLDFRCNICKVIFIGIGTLFYVHWSKHVKDPFWMASEQTFPKHAIISSRLKRADNSYNQNATTLKDSIEDYTQIAEHICQNCKSFLLNADDLKKHVLRCTAVNSDEATAATENSNPDVQDNLTVKIICSLCCIIFTKKTEFYQHIGDKHNFNSEFQFVCRSITSTKKMYICNVCMVIIENLDQFQEHWLQHYATHVYFNCTHCVKKYCNSLNSFIEHAKVHETDIKEDVPSCLVNYQDARFICRYCGIGFGSSESLSIHNVTHKQTRASVNSKSDNILSHKSSATASDVNHTTSSTRSKESTTERQQEESLAKSKESTTEKQQEESLTKLQKSTTERRQEESLTKPQESTTERVQEESLIKSKEASVEKQQEESLTRSKESTIERQQEVSFTKSKESTAQRQQEESLTMLKESVTERQQHESLIKPKELTIEKQLEQSLLKVEESTSEREPEESLIATDKVAEQTREDCQSKTSDKEELLRILEGSDDSNDELVIDLIEHSEDDDESCKRVHEEKQTASNVDNVQSVVLDTEGTVSSETSKQSTATNVENTQNTKVYDTPSTERQKDLEIVKDLLPAKEPSPKKISRGFIRVKTLAELTDSVCCHLCGFSVHGSDNLIQHLDTHNTVSKASKEPETSTILNQPSGIVSQANYSMESTTTCDRSSVLPQINLNAPYQRVSNDKTKTTAPHVSVLKQQFHTPQKIVMEKQHSKSAHHKNLPHCNVVQVSKFTASTSSKRYVCIPIKEIRVSNLQDLPKLRKVRINKAKHISFFNKEICLDGADYRYKCKFCDFHTNKVSECLLHELPGSTFFCKKQTIRNVEVCKVTAANVAQNKGCQQSVVTQPRINCASPTVYYQYPYIATSSSNSSGGMNMQNQPTIANQSMTGTASTPLYYKNPTISSGGMSIVINQTAPVTQNIPGLGMLQQPMQQQMYQPQFYTESVPVMGTSYVQQPQNVVGFLRSNGVYEISNNQYNATHTGGIGTTYEVMLQPPPATACSYCPKTISFVNEELLQIHVNTYHNFKCNICGLRFYNFEDWSAHKDTHNSI